MKEMDEGCKFHRFRGCEKAARCGLCVRVSHAETCSVRKVYPCRKYPMRESLNAHACMRARGAVFLCLFCCAWTHRGGDDLELVDEDVVGVVGRERQLLEVGAAA